MAPIGWKKAKLGDIADLVGGGTPSRKKPEYFTGDIVWLTPSQIPKNRISLITDSEEKITVDGLKHSSAKILPEGTVLMTSSASIGYIAIADTKVTTNQGFASFICGQEIYNWYLAYWLMKEIPQIEQQATGTTFKEISKTKLKNFSIHFPTFDEQKRIVAKIEELFSQLDAGVAGLKRVKSELQHYRASVLKAAFEGRLVPQDPKDEPAKEFLNNLGIKLLDKGKSRFIPKSWELTRLENCVDILDRKRIPINSKEREKRISGKNFSNLYPYYGATGQVGWIDDYLFDEELVLLGEDGAPFLDINKDKAYIVKGKFWVNNHAHVLRAKDGLITNRFLLHYLNCFDFRDFVTGTTRLKLNQTRMKSIPIIIPPINEQNRIVEEIDRRLSIVQEIEKSFDTCLRNSQLVKNSILKSAFDGELIDQN
jgi:type I restriction enzyme S subunit